MKNPFVSWTLPLFFILLAVVLLSPSSSLTADTEVCIPPPSNMIGWWPGDGDANDIVNDNNGVLGGGAVFEAGMVGQAFSLDGTDDHVYIPEGQAVNLDGFSQLTIDAWIYPQELGPINMIVSKYNSANSIGVSYYFSLHGDKLKLAVFQSVEPLSVLSIEAQNGIILETWSHVAGVWNGGADFHLYVDGVEVEATIVDESSSPFYMADNDTPVNIGRLESFGGSSSGPGAYFHGLVDEIEIFDRALSESEIKSIYDAGSEGKCKGIHPADLIIEKAEMKFAGLPSESDGFNLQGRFVLHSDSDGVSLPEEQIEVMFGAASVVLPANSLSGIPPNFEFHDQIEGARVDIVIEVLDADRLNYNIEVHGVDLSGTANPADISLTIGNDVGFEHLRLAGKLKYRP